MSMRDVSGSRSNFAKNNSYKSSEGRGHHNFSSKLYDSGRVMKRGTPALHLNEPADGKLLCCWLGFGLVLRLYSHDISLFDPKK